MASSVLDLFSDLPPATLELMESARSWGVQHLEPLIPKHYDTATFPPHILESFRTHCPHLLGYALPQTYSGAGDYDLLTASHISMALAGIDASFTTTLLVQYGLCAGSILLCGNEEQKRRLLPSLAQLKFMGCFCLTEPQSGSDASDLRTQATKVERFNPLTKKREVGYTITGSKRWIGNGLSSEVFVVWARNMSLSGNPVMGFIVQQSHQQHEHAIRTSKIEGKVSMRMLQNANIEFDDAWCPDVNVMHDHVGFAESVGRVLEDSRVSVAWIPVGICLSALEKTIEYVKKREAFGAPLASNQLIQEKLVRMTAMVSSMYLLVKRVTTDYMAKKCGLPAIAMAKAYNSKQGRECISLAREMLGGNGIVLDYGIASKFCDMESIHTYEGTYDINVLVCGRAITGISAIKPPKKTKPKRSKL